MRNQQFRFPVDTGMRLDSIDEIKQRKAVSEGKVMKKYLALLLVVELSQSGCAFLGGASQIESGSIFY